MDDTADLEDLADVFILKFILDGLEENEGDSEISHLNWFGKIRRYLRGRIATSSRTTHWAAEIRGDLYETFRHREYYLPWKWRATLKFTAKEIWEKEPHRNLVERSCVGTTALSTDQIEERSNIIANFEQECLLTDSNYRNTIRAKPPAIFNLRRQLPTIYKAILSRDQCQLQ
jgi:hypothetical protein